MKIYYENIETPDNRFISIPMRIEACCNEIMIWVFKYPIDMDAKNQVIIKSDEKNRPDYYLYCQYCGQRHFFYKLSSTTVNKEENKEK